MEFWKYYRLFRRRWRMIGAVVVGALALGSAASWPRSQEYSASATLTTAPPDESRFVLILVTDPNQPRSDATRSLAIDLIRSRTVAERVIQRLNLSLSPQALRAKLEVRRDEGDLISLAVRDRDPSTAVLLANTYAEVAVAYNQEVNRRETALAREFIERQLADTRLQLTQAEDTLDAFKRKNDIVSIDAEINAQVARYQDLVAQLRTAEVNERELGARIAALRTELSQISSTKTDRQIAENPVAQRLRAELSDLQVQLAVAEQTYTDRHPTVIALRKRSDAHRRALADTVARLITTEFVQVNPVYETLVRSLIDLETQRIATQARRTALTQILPQESRRLPGLNTLQREYARLTRAITNLEAAQTDLEARLNDFRIREQAAMNRNLVYVVDTASAAQPVSPPRTLPRIVLSAMLGLAGAVGFVLFQHAIDDTVKNAREAEQRLHVPALTSIPQHNPPFDEAYRVLKINLGLHVAMTPRVLLFTSPRPGSGTSTVVYHLACAVARGGKRVAVVDADLRHPTMHRLFGVTPKAGLADVLSGHGEMADLLPAALRPASVDRVAVLPAGSAGGELVDLFASGRMSQLLEALRQRADVVLVDSPPVVPFAETRVLATRVDGVVLVMAARQPARGVEEEAKRQLERVGATLLGTVVNKVSPDEDDGYFLHGTYSQETDGGSVLTSAVGTGMVLLALTAVGMIR